MMPVVQAVVKPRALRLAMQGRRRRVLTVGWDPTRMAGTATGGPAPGQLRGAT